LFIIGLLLEQEVEKLARALTKVDLFDCILLALPLLVVLLLFFVLLLSGFGFFDWLQLQFFRVVPFEEESGFLEVGVLQVSFSEQSESIFLFLLNGSFWVHSKLRTLCESGNNFEERSRTFDPVHDLVFLSFLVESVDFLVLLLVEEEEEVGV